MDSEVKWAALMVTVVFGGLFAVAGLIEHAAHVEKMECMKLKGEYVGKSCIFRENRTQ